MKDEIIDISKTSPLRFLDYKIDKIKQDESYSVNDDILIKASELFQEFQSWATINNEYSKISLTKFGLIIKNHFSQKQTVRNSYKLYNLKYYK